MRWPTFNPSTCRAGVKQQDWEVRDKSGLHNEFTFNLDFIMRPCVRNGVGLIGCVNQPYIACLNHHILAMLYLSRSIFVFTNLCPFTQTPKVIPILGMRMLNRSTWSFKNMSFIILWTTYQSWLLLCFVKGKKLSLTFLTSFLCLHLEAKLALSFA